jgi:hypothetical protein
VLEIGHLPLCGESFNQRIFVGRLSGAWWYAMPKDQRWQQDKNAGKHRQRTAVQLACCFPDHEKSLKSYPALSAGRANRPAKHPSTSWYRV